MKFANKVENIIRIYCEQDSVIVNGNKGLYKNDSPYLMKYLVKRGQLEDKFGKVYPSNYLNHKLQLLNDEYHNIYRELGRNVKFTPESLYLSGYLQKALSSISDTDNINKWREYVFKNPIDGYTISDLIKYKDFYIQQNL